MKLLLVAALTLFASRLTMQDRADVTAWGRDLTTAFFGGDLDPVWESFTGEMQKLFGSVEALEQFHTTVQSQLGAETTLISETVEGAAGHRVYTRTASFDRFANPVQVVWGFDGEGKVSGFRVAPVATEAPTDHLDYRTKVPLRLPFDGEWFVFWGGRTLKQNYHTSTVDQRFAYDILIMKEGRTHGGDGKANEDYYCYGLPLRAPGDGVVVAAADGIEDNVPGVMNPRQALGNHVILEHGNGEFSLLAHFQKGSVQVKKGDAVKAGQELGRCGNSGNSSEPHLHFHLQNTAIPFGGEGLPAQFLHYVADGQPVERGEPVKGQVVRHAGAAAGDDEDPAPDTSEDQRP